MQSDVDPLSRPGFCITVLNKSIVRKAKKHEAVERKLQKHLKEFDKKHGMDCQEFSLLRGNDDSEKFLLEHRQLLREATALYLVNLAIGAGVRNENELMHEIAYQYLCLEYILRLSRHLHNDPALNVPIFYEKIKNPTERCTECFDSEFEKLKISLDESVREELNLPLCRAMRLGPGGLDPIEIYLELPETVKKSIELKDKFMLDRALWMLPHDKAIYCYQRLVAAGLWIPAKKNDCKNNEDRKLKD